MSIEYTIDLQLTEMGFPDILLPDKTIDPPDLIPELPRRPEAPGPSEESDAGPGAESDWDHSGASEEEEEEERGGGSPPDLRVGSDASVPAPESGEDLTCPVCSLQPATRAALLEHMRLFHGTQLSCEKCGKKFSQLSDYRLHMRTHRAGHFFCRVCQIYFGSQRDLTTHLAAAHPQSRFYECDNCKHVFDSLAVCQEHVRLRSCVEELPCPACRQSFTSRALYRQHRRTTCLYTHTCRVCRKSFRRKNALLRHSFSHLGCPAYTCVSCKIHFRKAAMYHAHKCRKNTIRCRVCLRYFDSPADFQQHIHDTGCWGNQELEEDAIRCLECGKSFETAEELKQHSSAHQKVLRCAECGKGFRSALLLMSHMGGHAGATPCLCQTCGLGFPHQQNFGSHLKTCGQELKLGSKFKKQQSPEESKPAPVSVSPGQPPEAATSDGCWKLTLDKNPPPGTNIVLLLPVQMQPTTGDAVDPGGSQNQLADPETGQDPNPAAAMDSDSSKPDASLPAIKSEPEESEISGSTSAPPTNGDALAAHVKDEPVSQMDSS